MNTYSINQALTDKKYLKAIQSFSEQIMYANSSISVNDLKSNDVFSQWYDKLDKTAKEKIDYVVGLDGNSENVSKEELKTILLMLDSEQSKNDKSLDGNINITNKSNIGSFVKNSIDKIYQKFVSISQYKNTKIPLPRKYSKEQTQSYENILNSNMRSLYPNPTIISMYSSYIESAKNAQDFVKSLETNKAQLMKDLDITNDEFDNLVNIALGIAEQETHFGGLHFLDTKGKTHFQRRLFMKKCGEMIGKTKSVGLTQIRYNPTIANEPVAKELCKKYGINSENDYKNNPQKAAIATIIVLRQKQITAQSKMWQDRLRENNAKIKNKSLQMTTDDITALMWNGMGQIVPRFKDKNDTVTINDKNSNDDVKDGTSYSRLVRAYREGFFSGVTTP